ncbi:P-domain proprotein convertase [Tritrichomonas foetus]|uniref:p-domain proprotein convertase n=1 Tax=Tritrichomonas foetus TaxID=1144522 RepID=A0A1J4J7I1_9EUKA|nr:P-domain proprotein convertase [Tritrichomonas foetus]|eukprot:OHS95190.1 P-domain proprotein convertase [Tritrichomonas foetus]
MKTVYSISMIFLFILQYWWLNNNGESFGIVGEDVNYTDYIRDNFNGSTIVINVMADGANVNHKVYEGRAIVKEFIDAFYNEPEEVPPNPKVNGIIGQKILSVAAGKRDFNQASGIAYASNVSSFNFYNATGHMESLEYTICHHADVWNITIVALIYRYCYSRECQYLRPDALPHKYADECLYEADAANQKHIVVPAGNYTSDVFFSPPGRWPLVFTIGSVSNRGFILNHGCEGAALFMVCPGTRENNDTAPARIPAALPDEVDSWDPNSFHESNASAAIFAGGLAIVMEANPKLTLSDHIFILAMTATKNSPASYLWKENAYGLSHNRRCGFGRLNLGKAVELAEKWEKPLGKIKLYSVDKNRFPPNPISLTDSDNEVNVTIKVDGDEIPDSAAVVEVVVNFFFADLGFGSFTCHLVSPNQDRRFELKILTEWSDLNQNIVELHLPSYQFLGEKAKGDWTLCIPKIDSASRGILVHVGMDVYYVDEAPDPKFIDQSEGANPNDPIPNNDKPFEFLNKSIPMVANESFRTSIRINKSYEHCWFVSYLQTDDSERQRLKVKPKVLDGNTTLFLPMVPTVFANNTDMKFAIESLGEGCGFTAEIDTTYINNLEPNTMWITGFPDFHIPLRTTSITVNWALNLAGILDDGYSTSVCISIISLESKQVLRRIFDRNTGSAEVLLTDENGETPSNRQFLLEISPSSPIDNSKITFKPIRQIITIETTDGPVEPYNNPFTLKNRIFICILMGTSLLFVVLRMILLAGKKIRKEEEEPFQQANRL